MSKNPFDDNSGYAKLVRAILIDTAEGLRKILQQHKLDDFADETGRNPLHIAALHERVSSFGPLIEAGASPHEINSDGVTPLDVAAEQNPESYQEMIIIARKLHVKKTDIKKSFSKRNKLMRVFGDESEN